MAKHLGRVVVGALIGVGLVAVGCSGSDDKDSILNDPGIQLSSGGGDGHGTPGVDPAVFQRPADADGDGAVTPADIVSAGAGQSISQASLDAIKESSCAAWQIEPEPLAASLFFVVDASSSMRDSSAEGTNGLPKWDVTRDAIIQAIRQMPDGSQVGALGYPNLVVTDNQCVNTDALFPAEFLGTGRDALIAAIEAIQTQTCTPTHDAYNAAVTHVAAADTAGQQYILLMTDGVPTILEGCDRGGGGCSAAYAGEQAMYDVMDAVGAAYNEHNIKTFILGSPGSEKHSDTGEDTRWWLSQAAELGGTSPGNCSHTAEPYCHFDMSVETEFANGLNRALGEIIGMVAQCEYSIPAPPPGEVLDSSAIHLVLAGGGTDLVEIYRSPTSDCQHGWYLDGNRVKLCSASCDVVQADALMELQWLFGCGAEPLEPIIT